MSAQRANETSAEYVSRLIDELGLRQISDSIELEKYADLALNSNQKLVLDYKSGKEKALNAIFGHAMKSANGKANPIVLMEILKEKLKSS